MLPFLYQTRTLQRALATTQFVPGFVRHAHTPKPPRDYSIPFDRDHGGLHDDLSGDAGASSTLTPSEANVFKSIFEEIAQGRLPHANRRSSRASQHPAAGLSDSETQDKRAPRSAVEQSRVAEFRQNFLRRYPPFLQRAAQIALEMHERDEAGETEREERAPYDRARVEERKRVDGLMRGCDTDVALWQVMENEVFSLPEKLGIAEDTPRQRTERRRDDKAKGKAAKENNSTSTLESAESPLASQQQSDEEKRIMDLHGPLYPHFINTGLFLFETAFAHPSSFAFQILPRVKALGLPSYVLGGSTPFYSRLARIHWNRFGDANSALDVLREMNAAGLYADDDVKDLLVKIRDHLHGCTWGAQGPFVLAMMESPPYDGALTQRLDEMERYTKQSLRERAREYAA